MQGFPDTPRAAEREATAPAAAQPLSFEGPPSTPECTQPPYPARKTHSLKTGSQDPKEKRDLKLRFPTASPREGNRRLPDQKEKHKTHEP